MYSKIYFLTLTMIYCSLVSGQRCFDQVRFNYFTCEQSCTPVNQSLALIDRCSILARFGCELKACDGNAGYECIGPAQREILTCANSRVIFRDGDPSKTDFKFGLDLNTPPAKGDYYFLINARLTMRKFLPSLKESVVNFINSVNGSSEIRFGVGIYRNEDMLDMGYMDVQSLSNDHEAVRNVVNGMTLENAKGGADANLQAIAKASTQDFRADAKKIIFMLGNTPGHEPSKVGSGEPLTRQTVAKMLKDAGISFVAINYRNPGLNGRTDSFGASPTVETEGGQANFIARETGGIVVFRSNSVFDAFWKAKSNVERVYDFLDGNCSAFVERVVSDTDLPVTIGSGTSAVLPVTLKIKNGFCTPFSCQFLVTENGLLLQPLTIEVPLRTDGTCSSR